MPLRQDIEDRHREGYPAPQGRPRPMTELLEVADRREHRQDGLNHHPDIPGAPFARLHIRRIPRFGVEPGVGQDHHLVLKLADQTLERRIGGIRRGVIPGHNQPILIEDVGNLRPNDPAMVRQPLATNLTVSPILAPWMAQFDAVAIGHAQDGGFSQEILGPVHMRRKEPKQARALGQGGKPVGIIPPQPAVERAWADTFEREEEGQRDDLAGIQLGLWMLWHRLQLLVNTTKQGNDKIAGRHTVLHPLKLKHPQHRSAVCLCQVALLVI